MLPHKKKLFQRLMISLMCFVAALALVALYFRYQTNRRSQNLLSVIQNSRYPGEQAAEALLLLNQSENDFQLAILSYSPQKLEGYKNKLQEAFVKIDSLTTFTGDSLLNTSAHKPETRQLFQQKVVLSEKIFELKKSFDSVILLADKFTARNAQTSLFNTIERLARQRAAAQQQNVDTVKAAPVVETRRKGFFRKLKDAFSSKQDTIRKGGATIINNTVEKTYRDTIHHTQVKVITADAFYQQLLHTLRNRQKQLSTNQANMIIINQHMMEQLKQLTTGLQACSYALSENIKATALLEYHHSQQLLNRSAMVSLLLLLVFAVIIISYVRKIGRAEQQLARKYELATNLAQQKTDLLATMSHEIRNPLNAIIGFLQELKKSGLTAAQTEMLDSVQFSSDMLLGTVNHVLDMSRLESGRFQLQSMRFNPYRTLGQAVESMRFSAQHKHLDLQYHFTGVHSESVTGDLFRLNQLVINLLSNAIKYTDKGSVTVRATLEQQGNRPVLTVAVTDTGAGMSKAQQAQLFTQYYQVNAGDAQKGSGLGLYICHKLVQLQNGTIQVESTPGKGTTMQFFIPYSNAAVQAYSGQSAPVADISIFSGKKILVADDNELNLKLVSIMTRNWNAEVLLATNGKSAFELLQKESVDIVLTDMEMAGMDGKALVNAIRSSHLNFIPVILTSAHTYDAEETAALKQAGFTDVLPKPFNEMQLAQKLYSALTA